jgi:hypothetical protein
MAPWLHRGGCALARAARSPRRIPPRAAQCARSREARAGKADWLLDRRPPESVHAAFPKLGGRTRIVRSIMRLAASRIAVVASTSTMIALSASIR